MDNLKAMWNTIVIALAVTLFGTIMGLFYAWLLGRSDIPAKGFMRAMFTIPYMFPPFWCHGMGSAFLRKGRLCEQMADGNLPPGQCAH